MRRESCLLAVCYQLLQVGVGGLSIAQQRSHFALWALVKAPLLIGANLEDIPEDSLAILKAKEVRIYVCVQADCSRTDCFELVVLP